MDAFFISKKDRRGRDAGEPMPATHLSLHFHIVFSTKDRHPSARMPWRAGFSPLQRVSTTDAEAV
jgi:hypothetical protein